MVSVSACKRLVDAKCLAADVAKADTNWSFKLTKSFALTKQQRQVNQDRNQVALLNFKTKSLVIILRENHLDLARINVIVPKKHVALAVGRNRIKRWVREQFRLRQTTLRGVDLVVICRYSGSKMSFVDCQNAFNGLIKDYQKLAC